MISLALAPMMWAPSTWSVVASATSFTNPAVSPSAMLRPWARNGKRPILTVRPSARASRSVRPTLAISGLVKVAAGAARQLGCAGCPEMNVDLLLLELALERLGDLVVLGGDQPGQHLDQRHLGADRGEEAGELGAHDPAPEHRQAPGLPREVQRFLARHHALAVELEAR